mmetsp:Transcript_11916/g.21375  ORF Transcript_11916/g.21375 Transcript_11916/m.21375 type:complete len:310 (-) Transcript_11916:303-1232(-)
MTSSITEDPSLYTRGTGQTENVGQSMVQKHAEMLQQQLEENSVNSLTLLMPNLGSLTRILALKETNWDVDKTAIILRKFIVDQEDKLAPLQKKRQDIIDSIEEDDDEESSGSESGSPASASDRKRKSRKNKKKKSKDEKDEKKNRSTFGKYGIIRESDALSMDSEFSAWAMEIKKVDIEHLKPFERRTLFREFMEDYNAGTLPHKKYYDLAKYEQRRAAKAAAKGPAEKRSRVVEDEEALRKERAAQREKEARERYQQAYDEVKYGDKARDMKEQEMLRYQMNLAYKTGDRAKAQKIQERLMPDELKKK